MFFAEFQEAGKLKSARNLDPVLKIMHNIP